MAVGTPAESGRKLHREHIVTAALELLNEAGFSKLTVRSLAARLDVQAAALYWHVKNKQELIDAMAAAIMPPQETAGVSGWRTLLERNAYATRNTLMRYRDGAQVIAHANMAVQEQALAAREATLTYLVGQGFTVELAMASVYAVMRFTLGCVFEEQADPRTQQAPVQDEAIIAAFTEKYPTLMAAYTAGGHRNMQQALDKQFERSLAIIMDGIQVRLDASKQVS